MSLAIAVYLGVAGLAWGPCAFAIWRLAGFSGRDRLFSSALLAVGWPLTVPLIGLSLTKRSRRAAAAVEPRPNLRIIPGGAADARITREAVAAKR